MPAQNFEPDSELFLKANPNFSSNVTAELLQAQALKHQVNIAIIDSGVDYLHPKLQRHLRFNDANSGLGLDVLGHDSNPYPIIMDPESGEEVEDFTGSNPHGTHVASLALLGASLQLAGMPEKIDVGPLLGLIPIRVLPLTDEGIPTEGSDVERDLAVGKKIVENLVDAIKYSVNAGADIANLSLGIETQSLEPEAQEPFIREVEAKLVPALSELGADVLFLFAAGNENAAVVSGNYPASLKYPNTLTIGALKSHDTIAEYSNYGEMVDVYVRGSDINGLVPGGLREKMSGTSMATPLVANLAAKMKLLAPCLKAWELKNLILESSSEKVLKVEGTESDTRTVKVVSFKQGLASARIFQQKYCR